MDVRIIPVKDLRLRKTASTRVAKSEVENPGGRKLLREALPPNRSPLIPRSRMIHSRSMPSYVRDECPLPHEHLESGMPRRPPASLVSTPAHSARSLRSDVSTREDALPEFDQSAQESCHVCQSFHLQGHSRFPGANFAPFGRVEKTTLAGKHFALFWEIADFSARISDPPRCANTPLRIPVLAC